MASEQEAQGFRVEIAAAQVGDSQASAGRIQVSAPVFGCGPSESGYVRIELVSARGLYDGEAVIDVEQLDELVAALRRAREVLAR